jgi:hypothetical protein
MKWEREFPNLHLLYQASETSNPDNYFSEIEFAKPSLKIWEDRLSRLDVDSRNDLIKRAAPYVCQREKKNDRHWSQLFETLNEAKGYVYLLKLGYTSVQFIPRTSQITPDLKADGPDGHALLEVKTVNYSDKDIALRGTLQKGHFGLTNEFKNKLAEDFDRACRQLRSIVTEKTTRRICYFCITLDLPIAIEKSNYRALCDYLVSLETGDCEIEHESQFWNT